MTAILFALVTYFGWGIGDVFGTVAARKMGTFSETFWSAIISLFLFIFCIPFVVPIHLNWEIIVFNMILGAIFFCAYFGFTRGTQIGNAPLVGTIASCSPAISILLSRIIFNEHINIAQAFGILVIFLGLILSMVEIEEIKKQTYLKDKGAIWGVVAMIAWGIYFSLIKIPIKEYGWFWPTFITYVTMLIVFIVIKIITKAKIVSPNTKGAFIPLIGAIILIRVGEFAYNIAISQGLTSIVAPIASSAVTLFAPLAYIVFKDTITRKQIIGLAVTIFGIVLLSFFSV